MPITKEARDDLEAMIVPHPGQEHGKLTKTGMIKTRRGLVIRPSTFSGQKLKSGDIVELSEEERDIMKMDEEAPQDSVPSGAVRVSALAKGKGSKKKTATKTKVKATNAVPEHTDVIVDIVVGGLGTIRSQCHHCYKGKGVVVMGMTPLSYKPAVAAVDDEGTLSNVMALSIDKANSYVFMDEEFTDGDGVKNIILHAVPNKQEAVDDEEEYDDEEEDYDDDEEEK